MSIKEDIKDLCDRSGIILKTFDVIYELTDWLKEELEKRKTKKEILETTGRAKVLKVFSRTKDKQVIGARVLEGKMILDQNIKILRREHEIGQGKIKNLEQNKIKMKEVEEGVEFGMLAESKKEIAPGDIIEAFVIDYK